MRKWMVVPILIAALFLGLPNHAAAAETMKADVVYVAGNPNLFPFEYYDTQSDCYCGILPELYKELSLSTGLEFVYIHPGIINQQNRLAKNGQVDLVSAYVRGEIDSAEQELILLQYDENTEICVAFTVITPDWVEDLIRSSLKNLSAQQILELSLRVPEPQPEQRLYLWAAIIGLFLILMIAVLASVLIRQEMLRKKKDRSHFIDPLTGIGNTAYFEKNFSHCITQHSYALYYLSYISLDVQKVEQYLGDLKAEEIQRYAADVLSHTAADRDFAARIGNGVFLLTFQAPSVDAAEARINEILKQLNQYEGTFLQEHRIPFHAGIFQIDTAAITAETAVFNARQGYNAAVHNQLCYVFTDKALLNREKSKIELRQNLLNALENHEFQLYMQMIVDRDERIIGAEALSRWQNREKGLLYPGVFIEPLQSANLIDKLDFYILEEVCKQLEEWSLTDKAHLWISCNITRMTVSRSDFTERFQAVLEQYRFSRDRLIVELTEDSLMDNTTIAYSNTLACKKIGCQVALDDLGSGYSSLQDLCDYPIDMIKIDRHILLKSTTPRGNVLLQGLTNLGHDLGMKVLCEGVESEAEKQRVLDVGCDYMQGFYYSRVLPRDEADLFYMRSQNDRLSV